MLNELLQHGRHLIDRADQSIVQHAMSRQSVGNATHTIRVPIKRPNMIRLSSTAQQPPSSIRHRNDADEYVYTKWMAKKFRHQKVPMQQDNDYETMNDTNDLTAILAHGRSCLERADRTIQKFYDT